MSEREAILHTDGWGGRQQQRVIVVDETAKRYRIKAPTGSELRLPNGPHGLRIILSSGTHLVPKHAVTFSEVGSVSVSAGEASGHNGAGAKRNNDPSIG